jgi:response regulator NasT
VLIAEDETVIRLDLCAQLEDAGHEVAGEARDGVEAVALARELQPDIAVLDVKMPRLDGIEAARRIRGERPIPIVIVTAFDTKELVDRAADAGAYGYLSKPFAGNDLPAAISLATARHKELEELRDEVGTLADALAARKAIERAKGLLMEREGLTEGAAFARLRNASQRSGQPLKLIAEAIVVALG